MYYYRHPVQTLSLLAAGAMSLLSTQALASGFALHEQSAALLGGFYAGSAAIAEDASTNWYNSAGLTRLQTKGNFVITGFNISTLSEFEGSTSLTTFTPTGPAAPYVETGESEGGTARFVPALHAAYKINKKWALGLSVTTPFGLSTNYEEDSIARYNATESEIKAFDIAPSIAYQATDWLSFGAGFDAEYVEAKLDAMLGCTVCGATPTEYDSLSKNKANDWGWGYHAGFLAVFDKTKTQFGMNFHSNIDLDLSGRSKLHGPINPYGYESEVTSEVTLPWWMVASFTQKLSESVTLLGSVEYMAWDCIETLVLHGVETGGATGTTATSVDELNYENTWAFFGGLRYQAYSNVMLSVGGGYEETPTNDQDRDLRLPDANRWIASCGVRWVPNAAKNVQLDFGYAHLWGEDVNIDKELPAETQLVTATGSDNSQVNIFGAQLTLKM